MITSKELAEHLQAEFGGGLEITMSPFTDFVITGVSSASKRDVLDSAARFYDSLGGHELVRRDDGLNSLTFNQDDGTTKLVVLTYTEIYKNIRGTEKILGDYTP
jgi:hypothetical protein